MTYYGYPLLIILGFGSGLLLLGSWGLRHLHACH